MRKIKTKKRRNYSFQTSKRLQNKKMTELNGIVIPSMPGSCYHAIICALAEFKDQFIPWNRIIERTERYMIQYGGDEAWDQFRSKKHVKPYQQRIRDNTHTLTRSGKDCYGFRLHEQGMVIYFFKDGAVLHTGGKYRKTENGYNVYFQDGKRLQVRYRGDILSYREYSRFLDLEYINPSGKIVNKEGIKEFRDSIASAPSTQIDQTKKIRVSIILDDSYDQYTADRLESCGLVVLNFSDNEIIGILPEDRIEEASNDKDVLSLSTH